MQGGVSVPFFAREGALCGLACRLPFGIGAVIGNAVLLLFCVHAVQQILGGPPHLGRTHRCAEVLLLITLAPLLLLLLIIVLIQAAAGAVATRLRTGSWPHNEDFIRRQQAKGLLGRLKGRVSK